MRLAVITVNYEAYQLTNEFIINLKKVGLDKHEVRLYISDLSPTPIPFETEDNIEIILGKNKGYAHGLNLGLKKAISDGYDNFVVINNDVIVSSDFFVSVKSSLEKNKDAIVGGKIYYAPHHEYHKDRYKKNDLGNVLWYAGGVCDWRNVQTNHVGVDEVDVGKYDKMVETEFITGCLMCFSKTTLDRVGFMDESYFMYYEDADWCERAKNKKVKLIYDPSIIIWHKNGQSTGGSGSPLQMRYQEKNRLFFGLKYAPLRTKAHLLKNYFADLKLIRR